MWQYVNQYCQILVDKLHKDWNMFIIITPVSGDFHYLVIPKYCFTNILKYACYAILQSPNYT